MTTPSDYPKLDVIAVGAHPDDVEIACGGTLARLVEQGYQVGIIDLTDGEPTPGSPGPEVRLAEAKAAAEVLGVQHRVTLDMPNRKLFDSYETRVKLAIEFRKYRPRLVIGFGEKTPMASPDHWQAMQITDAAVFYSKLTKWDADFDGLPPHTIEAQLYFTLAFYSGQPMPGPGHLVCRHQPDATEKARLGPLLQNTVPAREAGYFCESRSDRPPNGPNRRLPSRRNARQPTHPGDERPHGDRVCRRIKQPLAESQRQQRKKNILYKTLRSLRLCERHFLRSAELLRQTIADFTKQDDIFCWLFRCGFFFFLHRVHHLNGRENRGCNNEKINGCVNESTVVDRNFFDFGDRRITFSASFDTFLDDILHRRKIHAACQLTNSRHDNVFDQRADNLAERATDDHTDRHIDDVAFECEVFELLDHSHF